MFPLAPDQSLSLRAVDPSDQAFLDHLYFTTRSDLQQLPMPAPLVEQLIGMQQRTQVLGFAQSFPHAQHWLILLQDAAVGRLVVDITSTDIRVVDVALLPQAQGQGYGRTLLSAVLRFAQERQLAVNLAVSKANFVAKNLYTSLGFELQAGDEMFDQMLWRAKAVADEGLVHHAA